MESAQVSSTHLSIEKKKGGGGSGVVDVRKWSSCSFDQKVVDIWQLVSQKSHTIFFFNLIIIIF